jgi:adenine-specific DNA-methyltransferase
MCCGGASVGLNVNAKYVVCFDNNKKVIELYKKVYINDSLYSNYVFYNAWLSNGEYNQAKIYKLLNYYNNSEDYIKDNYFSDTFSGTYFSYSNAKFIGSVREHLETIKNEVTEREYYILLSSLLYSTDKIANTVGFQSFV